MSRPGRDATRQARGAQFPGTFDTRRDRPLTRLLPPYGYKFFISPETSVRAAAIRSGRADIEFRGLPNAEVEAITKHLGDKVVVQRTPMVGQFGIGIINTVKPFTDARVRKAHLTGSTS